MEEYVVLGDDGCISQIVHLNEEAYIEWSKTKFLYLRSQFDPLPDVGWRLLEGGFTPPSAPVVNKEYIVSNIIKPTKIRLSGLIEEFAAENVLMGITQLGKTQVVSDYLQNIQRYAGTGSAQEVKNEIDRLISAGIPSELAPFVTEERLLSFKAKV